MASTYTVLLLGPPAVRDSNGTLLTKLASGKPLALLAYLLVEGPTPRDEIVALLWDDTPETRARNAFRQALHRLRSALGENVVPHDSNLLSVSSESGLITDVALFEKALADGDVEGAIAGYRGDFLAGMDVRARPFEQWQLDKRKQFNARFRDALSAAITADLRSGANTRAVERASKIVQSGPLDANAAILYATALLGTGRRIEALHSVEAFVERYRSELETPPPAAVRELLVRLRRPPSSSRPETEAADHTSFVGRARELGTLMSKFTELERGLSATVLLEGDTGSGKTRLLDEFLSRASDTRPCLTLFARERASERSVPYASIAEALRASLDAPGLAGTSQHLLAEAARLLPQLRDQFSLPAVSDVTDDTSRLRFFEGVAALLESVAYEQHVCLVLDDFHNCDEATFDLVAYLVERLRSAGVLFVLSARPVAAFTEMRSRLLDRYSRSAKAEGSSRSVTLIELPPLDPEAALELARQDAGVADATTLGEIVAIAGGNPARIIEVARRASTGQGLADPPIPIRNIVWARLQQCTQQQQRLYVASALLGRPAGVRLLAACAHVGEAAALDAAAALERLGLLVQSPGGLLPAHDFAEEIAADGTGLAGRALLAAWAAEAVESDGSGTDAELATLFDFAGEKEKVFKYSRRAGYALLGSGAVDAAQRFFEVAYSNSSSELERREISSLVSTIGGGVRRLPGEVEQPAVPGEAQSAEEKSVGSPQAVGEAGGLPPREATAPTEREDAVELDHSAPTRTPHTSGMSRRVPLGIVAGLLAAALFAIVWRTARGPTGALGTSLSDTLVVAQELSPRNIAVGFTTGPIGTPIEILNGATRLGASASWIDSVRPPWINPLLSPDRRFVSLERMTGDGSDLYVISIGRLDTVPLARMPGDDISYGWSPDSRWLLATHGGARPDGTYSSSLFAYSLRDTATRIPLDTISSHAVVDAAWSPGGTHIAWIARVGAQRQQDLFVSDADGGNQVNLSDNPSEEYGIAWSPTGRTIAFTSERTGRAELYSIDLATRKLRRLTWDGAHSDHAAYSPDGRWLAYESTRGGNPSVYVMPAYGGTGRLVAAAPMRIALIGWRGREVPYVESLAIEHRDLSGAMDTATLLVHSMDVHGRPIEFPGIRVASLDPALVRIESADPPSQGDSGTYKVRVTALADGLARIVATTGGWRADTVFVPVGQQLLTLLDERWEGGLLRASWISLGTPRAAVEPGVGEGSSRGLVTFSGREWESGVLSNTIFPIRGGLAAETWVRAPFTGAAVAGRSFSFALVAADPVGAPDSTAPQFLRLATLSWLSESARMSYSVGREIRTEPVGALGNNSNHVIRMVVEPDRTVAFFVDGVQRWRSTATLQTTGGNSRAQLWIAGRGTGSEVAFDDVSVTLGANPTRQSISGAVHR